jgi:predicted HTH domain antitoxin
MAERKTNGRGIIMLEKTIPISFSVKEDILLSLKENTEEFTQNLRFLSALMLYRKSKLSLGKAAELAGFNKLDFIEKLKLENEPVFDFNADDMANVFEDVNKLP